MTPPENPAPDVPRCAREASREIAISAWSNEDRPTAQIITERCHLVEIRELLKEFRSENLSPFSTPRQMYLVRTIDKLLHDLQ